MKILSVVGARPQFVKLAPIAHAMAEAGVEHVIVHTGQHYDHAMSDSFFEELGIPAPDENLTVGSGTHGRQTGAMLAGMDEVLERHRPDGVLVYGDTNSTLAGTLSAVKMHVPLAHLEAGLRSFNRRMPEEHNRVLTDHAADLCLAPTEVAMAHLAAEGITDRAVLVGDVMTDVLHQVRDRVADLEPSLPVDTTQPYRVATLHRADNTDDEQQLRTILDNLASLDVPTLLLAHPRLRAKAAEFGLDLSAGSVVAADPLPYPQLVRAVMGSAGVITDSGGLQKEAFLLRVPCTTVRTETEWVETVELGWNVLVTDPATLARDVDRPQPAPTEATPYGDGHAATRVVQELQRWRERG
ncbi:non-hydrolyzing UDP-N-acetylglucosamine 2-epimerase [Arsenicicoccus sp. oral taxon 190]|uniref:non-hydrolyzing UDP-N-acetylglucosamine 2-epimerase n=1 Tax=Arsenicicoccus sp. oral taxon 190 TaxID=1658671 RepID=UPI00067A29FF|nr:UDP-N-acetylglucosamine 2-epimerase (non-hydrolyzing) [Arsenicicoccus sp. oral taxon 190]AKT50870.1 UDP-N-acetylglucosamine 2-epimerase [Arsenicicoccus sp. oral taxon 190]